MPNEKRLCIVIANNRTSENKAPTVVYLYPDTKLLQPTHVHINVNNTVMTARCEHVQSIDNKRFIKQIGKISDTEKEMINQALMLMLGYNSGINPQGIFTKWERYTRTYHLWNPTLFAKDQETKYRQFDIHYITEHPTEKQKGHEIWPNRPAVIISNNMINNISQRINIVYLSTANRPKDRSEIKTHAHIRSYGKPATALCEQIYAIDRSQISDKMDSLNKTEQYGVLNGILYSLQLNLDIQAKKQFYTWEDTLKRNNFYKK